MRFIATAFLFLSLFFSASSNAQKQMWILDENFDVNSWGWIEESTNSHITLLKDGYLHIHSIDTSKYQTSNAPLSARFLLGLPKEYTITASFLFTTRNLPATLGVILESGSLKYRFSFSDSLVAALSEYDYNTEEERDFISKQMTGISLDKAIIFRIRFDNWNVEFFVNDEKVGESLMRARSWMDLRLYTTSGSAIKVDYLRIK